MIDGDALFHLRDRGKSDKEGGPVKKCGNEVRAAFLNGPRDPLAPCAT